MLNTEVVLNTEIAKVQLWVWHLPSLNEARVAALLPTLIPAEQALYHTIRSPRRQREYLAGHHLLRVALSGLVPDWAEQHHLIMAAEHRLHLQGPLAAHLDFNLSHSGDWVACVVGLGCQVGVDIEMPGRRRAYRALAEEYFAVAESQRLARLTDEACRDAFYELWTLKESYLKARKQGLSAAGLAIELVPLTQAEAPWYCYALRLPCAAEVFAALTLSVPLPTPLEIRDYSGADPAPGVRLWKTGAPKPLTPRADA